MNVQQPMESLQLRARQLLNRATLRDNIAADLALGIESVPDGLAQGFLASVNPIFSLYGYVMGTF
jgi:SulP family sulfate permease